jgi:uncharacterized protein YgbK (DUF1537 family)
MPADCTVAIADDLTGALEIGAKFAAHGLRSIVTTTVESKGRFKAPVLVIDTETRHASAQEAAMHTRRAAAVAHERSAQLVYKKTDSTLRGNIAVEFEALQAVFPNRRIVYAPAYPELGRTVKDGRLFVHGIPVNESDFANDRWSQVRDSSVHALVRNVNVLVMDGECREDIEHAASLILAEAAPRICAGPAGLAGELARMMGSETVTPFPPVARCLVVNGSLHPASIAQITVARQAEVFDHNWKLLDEPVEGSGTERAARVGECVRRVLKMHNFDAVIIFGGETAFGIHRALGAEPFEALGEIEPGVAVSRSGGLIWVTKAGGFGPPDMLKTIRERLR